MVSASARQVLGLFRGSARVVWWSFGLTVLSSGWWVLFVAREKAQSIRYGRGELSPPPFREVVAVALDGVVKHLLFWIVIVSSAMLLRRYAWPPVRSCLGRAMAAHPVATANARTIVRTTGKILLCSIGLTLLFRGWWVLYRAPDEADKLYGGPTGMPPLGVLGYILDDLWRHLLFWVVVVSGLALLRLVQRTRVGRPPLTSDGAHRSG